MDRNETMKRIKTALKRRSGKDWSVTGNRGTAWGWLEIDAPPKRRTWQYLQTTTMEPPKPGAVYRGMSCVTPNYRVDAGAEDPIICPQDDPWVREAIEQGRALCLNWEAECPEQEYGHMSPEDRVELGKLLGLDRPVHYQGQSIPPSGGWEEFIDRAEGREPTTFARRDWD